MALQNSVSQYRAAETATIRDSAAAAIYRAPPGLQSFSLSRFPLDVDRRVHVQHRNLDAESRAELADLHADRFQVSARAGPGSQRSPDLPLLIVRRRARRPHRPPSRPPRIAVR